MASFGIVPSTFAESSSGGVRGRFRLCIENSRVYFDRTTAMVEVNNESEILSANLSLQF